MTAKGNSMTTLKKSFLKNKIKSFSILSAIALALFGIQATVTSPANAVGWNITFPLSGQTINGYVGIPLSVQFSASGGAAGGIIVNADYAPVLPPGFSLSASGVLSGTPAAVGTYMVNFSVYDGLAAVSTANGVILNFSNIVPAPAPSASASSTPAPPPVQKGSISGISPTSGPTAGGTSVTIAGSFPDPLVQVHFNNVAISASLWKQSASGITITTPPHAAGPVSIQIYNGQFPLLAAQTFTYTDVPAASSPAATPTPTPSATPTVTPTPTAAPTPTVAPSPTATPTLSPTSTPAPIPAPVLKKRAIINFDNDSFVLNAAAKAEIKALAAEINNSSASAIYLYGYTDVRGDAAYNLSLSKKRAQAVSDYLSKLLTNLDLKVGWKGAKNPAATGNTEADYAKNRRVEIWVK